MSKPVELISKLLGFAPTGLMLISKSIYLRPTPDALRSLGLLRLELGDLIDEVQVQAALDAAFRLPGVPGCGLDSALFGAGGFPSADAPVGRAATGGKSAISLATRRRLADNRG